MKFFRSGLMIIIVLLNSVILLLAQADQGRVLGTVTDASGAVVAGAKVTVTNTATNVTRNLVSNRAGDYVAPRPRGGHIQGFSGGARIQEGREHDHFSWKCPEMRAWTCDSSPEP